jgi:hypothetical protein
MKQPPVPTPVAIEAIHLLARPSTESLSSEEENQLTRELSAAYHMDETAATSRDVQRIAEKVRAHLLDSHEA